jgi:predicted sulfurtransferase
MDNNPNCLIIDVRNSYETKIGYFEGAIKPGLKQQQSQHSA